MPHICDGVPLRLRAAGKRTPPPSSSSTACSYATTRCVLKRAPRAQPLQPEEGGEVEEGEMEEEKSAVEEEEEEEEDAVAPAAKLLIDSFLGFSFGAKAVAAAKLRRLRAFCFLVILRSSRVRTPTPLVYPYVIMSSFVTCICTSGWILA